MDIVPSTDTVPLFKGDLNILDIINNISEELHKNPDSSAQVKNYLEQLKENYVGSRTYYKDDEILKLIEKHPYFRNPCKYPIRIISIMKFLKRKGIDISEHDMDLRVDDIISKISYVERVEYGLYKINI